MGLVPTDRPGLQLSDQHAGFGAGGIGVHEEFWQSCFIDLFCRGDCRERDPRRKEHGAALSGKKWCKVLLSRVDTRKWRLRPEFIACCFNVFLRREILYRVCVTVKQPWFQQIAPRLDDINSEHMLHVATKCGGSASIRQTLRDKHVPEIVKLLLRNMQAIQGNVPCTDAYRAAFRHKFSALNLWDGASVIFFTLNPADTKNELTLTFACPEVLPARRIRLNWGDEEKSSYYQKLSAWKMHEIVANDPVAAMRCFYTQQLGSFCGAAS